MLRSFIRKFPSNWIISGLSAIHTGIKVIGLPNNRYKSTIKDDGTITDRQGKTITDADRIVGRVKDVSHNRNIEPAPSKPLSTVTATSQATLYPDENREFMAVFTDILRDLKEITMKHNPELVSAWITRCFEYNLPYGKKYRGLLTVQLYKNLAERTNLTTENVRLAHILGWCVEMLNASFLVNDDILDSSTTRRGQTCWYKLPDVGLKSINDAVLIENAIYVLLKKYFSNLDCYSGIMELFHDITYLTACGQCFDLLLATDNVFSFTEEKFNVVAINKTAYYTFYLPLALSMHLAGKKDAEAFHQAKLISRELGIFFQVQNDFLDCFGNPQISGKVGTDIQDNKCTWFVAQCLQRADDKQKQTLWECYGKNDPEMVQRVKELYMDLGLRNAYAKYEEETYNNIRTRIQNSSDCLPREILLQILNKNYQREK